MHTRLGRQTVSLGKPVCILSQAAVGGRQEAAGPLADWFDQLSDDSFFGEETWEKAESTMQKQALKKALEKATLSPGDLDYILAGDLLNQCIGSAFSLREFGIPFYGLYGACSTMGESIALASLLIAVVTFVICFAGLAIGKKVGTKIAGKASILGGAILIFIGIEIFVTSFF